MGQSLHAIVIDYGASNLRSVHNALQHVCPSGMQITVSSNPQELASASHVILPGVGAFGDCRTGLDAIPGMVAALEEAVHGKRVPFFGVCVGMQMMAERGLEHGEHAGLGWVPGEVVSLPREDAALKIPHMGWNSLKLHQQHPVLDGVKDGDHAYFVHSYHMTLNDPGVLCASVEYGQPVTAMIAKDNMVGTQFHPEKSQDTGLRLLHNFLRWEGR
jgi:glutamine amidotransferase